MPVEIEGKIFDLDASIFDGILEAMEGTAKDGIERGFQFCEIPSGKITAGQKCIGNSCSIQITDCKQVGGKQVGDFHSHPEVISFSLGDYLHSVELAKETPENKFLLCVSLMDKGVRCKALKKIPPKSVLESIIPIDSDEEREKVKPYFTKKLNISVEQIQKLKDGVAWKDLPVAEEIIAVDEGDDTCAPSGKECLLKPGQGGNMPLPDKQNLIQVAQEFIKEPSGKYPWQTKEVKMSVKGEGGIGTVSAGMPELVSDITQFIRTTDVELPDPAMIHYGEVAQYIASISPIILTQDKDANGKYKILDGRHRLAAWRAAGYTQIPVVFSKEKEYKLK
jgi:hypothetical protein